MAKSVQDILLEKLFKNLEENKELPWSRGFITGCINWYTETEYRGVNRWLLQGGSGEYLTFGQLTKYNEKNGTDYRPQKGTSRNVYWFQRKEYEITEEEYQNLDNNAKRYCIHKEDGTIVRLRFSERYYKVFDIKDCINSDGESLPSKLGDTIIEKYEEAEDVINKYLEFSGVTVKARLTDVAFYTSSLDCVVIPPDNMWNNANHKYRTLMHELVHSTGIKTRLDRDCFRNYREGRQIRSKEELVAEFGSVLLASECGIHDKEGEDNSEAYVTAWGEWLKENKDEIFSAMRMAERAAQYILEAGKNISEDELESKAIK